MPWMIKNGDQYLSIDSSDNLYITTKDTNSKDQKWHIPYQKTPGKFKIESVGKEGRWILAKDAVGADPTLGAKDTDGTELVIVWLKIWSPSQIHTGKKLFHVKSGTKYVKSADHDDHDNTEKWEFEWIKDD